MRVPRPAVPSAIPASTWRRAPITSTARSERVSGELPEGPARHFCRPAVAASIPHSSTCRSLPPREAVASVNSSAPCLAAIAPSSSRGWFMVVEVSPWTTARSFGRTVRTASSMTEAGNTCPHSVSSVWTSAPQRSAISTRRWPKRPKIGTSTLSPGSRRETSTASMPAREVPSTRSVASLRVRNTSRKRPWVSVMSAVIAGSNWPSSEADMARSTRGSALMGPGPMSSRGGGAICEVRIKEVPFWGRASSAGTFRGSGPSECNRRFRGVSVADRGREACEAAGQSASRTSRRRRAIWRSCSARSFCSSSSLRSRRRSSSASISAWVRPAARMRNTVPNRSS